MNIRDLAALIRRWWWLAGLFVAVGAIASLIATALATPVYAASTTLIVTQGSAQARPADSSEYNSLLAGEHLANTYSELLQSRQLYARVLDALSLDIEPETLAKRVHIKVVDDTQLITLSVEDSSRERAVVIANEIVKQFTGDIRDKRAAQFASAKSSIEQQLIVTQASIDVAKEQLDRLMSAGDASAEQRRLQESLAVNSTTYDTLLKNYQSVRAEEARSLEGIVAAEAQAREKPLRPRPIFDAVLAMLVGLVLAAATALFAERLDDSVRSSEDVAGAVGLHTLGMVSWVADAKALDPLTAAFDPKSSLADAFRTLRTNIEFAQLDTRPHTILVTSSKAGEGKSLVSAHLAVTLARSGKRVILVDSNLRRPTLHSVFKQTNAYGLTAALLAAPGSAKNYLLDTGIASLKLLSSGVRVPNPAELLHSKRMSELVAELSSQADFVVFDSPDLNGAADSSFLAGMCDAVLLVALAEGTRLSALRASTARLSQAGIRPMGVFLNGLPSEQGSSAYYYSYSALNVEG